MKKVRWLLALCLLLTGCSLARPEAESRTEDRFAGFYVVWESQWDSRSDFWSSDNPLLTEYGSHAVKLDKYGTFNFPDLVLFAQKEGEQWVFPGLEDGYSLFILHEERDFGPVTEVVSNMAPHDEGMHIVDTDDGSSETASGTIYYGPPLGEAGWDEYRQQEIWQAYRVYQAPDGTPYLDGSGNSFSGSGLLGSYTETHTCTTAENGESTTKATKITVAGEVVPRLEKLVVTQFDEANNILRADDLALREDLPEVRCEGDTAWVLVEEVSAGGTERTVYNVPDGEPVSHMVVLLSDEGLGHLAYLTIA